MKPESRGSRATRSAPRRSGEGEETVTVATTQFEAITAFARAARKDDPYAKRAVISMAPGLEVQHIVEVMQVLHGGDCRLVATCVIEELAISIAPP